MVRKKVKVIPTVRPLHYGIFIHPVDVIKQTRIKLPATTKLLLQHGTQPLHIDDDFGIEPVTKNLLPSYYYDVGQETKTKFYSFGKNWKEKR